MAQYKVIQDIEAEDKLLGPFSLRQFIYAAGCALMLYLCVIAVTKGVPVLLGVFLPPAMFCAFFAWPWSPDQPTEVWALARIRFFFKPRKRIWDQSGAKNLVTVTAPKRPQKVYTNGLTQRQVKSRLAALADTIDSRGWAVKNVNVSMASLPTVEPTVSDRLVSPSMMPQQVAEVDVAASDDIMDEKSNPIAAQFDQLINQAAQVHRQQLLDQMKAPDVPAPTMTQPPKAGQPSPDYWFLHQQNGPTPPHTENGNVVFANTEVVAPGGKLQYGRLPQAASAEDEAIAKQVLEKSAAPAKKKTANMHLKTVKTIEEQQAEEAARQAAEAQAAAVAAQAAKTEEESAIMNLAFDDDKDVATLARQAKKSQDSDEDEVVISLH